MSLERELVFEFLDKGKSKQEVLDTIDGMKELDVKMNSKIIDTALKQYESKQKLKEKKKYKKTFKTELKELIKKEKKRIEDTYTNLLSFRIYTKKDSSFVGTSCLNCGKDSVYKINAKIKYMNGNGRIPVKNTQKGLLFKYCERCGDINFDAECILHYGSTLSLEMFKNHLY